MTAISLLDRSRKLDTVVLPEMTREELGRLWAAHQLLHRHADLPGLTPEPGLVPGIDVADGDTGPMPEPPVRSEALERTSDR